MRALALSFALLLLAGCSGDRSAPVEPSSASPSTSFTVVGDNRIVAPAFTDTLHLLGQPEVSTKAPDAYTDLRLPVPAFSEQATAMTGATTDRLEWRFLAPRDVQGLAGTAEVWVDVRGAVVTNPSPFGGRCFWEFRFLTGDANTGESHFAPCVTENATVAEGVRVITFAFDLPTVSYRAGEEMRFEVYAQDFGRAPDASVHVLTGSVVHDSRITLVGLQLPVDAASLLNTI